MNSLWVRVVGVLVSAVHFGMGTVVPHRQEWWRRRTEAISSVQGRGQREVGGLKRAGRSEARVAHTVVGRQQSGLFVIRAGGYAVFGGEEAAAAALRGERSEVLLGADRAVERIEFEIELEETEKRFDSDVI